MRDYFAVLGLPRSASDAEIREAYRRLAKLYHPDSNPGSNDEESARRMQTLNEAKTVLLDPVKREEHRVMLGLREKLSAERLAQLRAEQRIGREAQTQYNGGRSNQFRFGPPRSKWDRVWRKWLGGIVAAILIAVTAIVTHEMAQSQTAPLDPIKQIIARYSSREIMPFDSDIVERDTGVVPDDSLPKLKRHGDILFLLGEYRSASRYYAQYLRHDTTNDEVITNLSLAYFKRGRYGESLEVLAKQMHGDSNLVVAYYNMGELFLKEEKPFDARNAFEAAVSVADSMRAHGRTPPAFTNKAKDQLAKLD